MRKNIFMKKFVVGLVIILLGMSFVQNVSGDWWMYGNDLVHSRYSASSAPDINDTKWIFATGDSVESSPSIVDNKVYVGSYDKKVYCLDAGDGSWIWEFDTGGYVHSSPAIYNNSVYIGSSDNKIYCLNASTGNELWNYSTGDEVGSSPAVANGKVYVGSSDNNMYCFYADNGTLNWNYTTGGSIISSPAVANNKVYFGSKDWKIYCLNADDGSDIWNESIDSSVNSSPAVWDGKVYIGGNDSLYCLNADTGAIIWSNATGDTINWSSPAVADDKVYISSSDRKFYCFNASTGGPIWNYTTNDEGWSSPAVANGKVYVGSWDGNVYCFGNLPPVFGTPSPANGSIDQPLGLTWSVLINDSAGDVFNWEIECSNGQTNSGSGETNGIKSLILSGLSYLTSYTVWVNATDPTGSGLYTREWYTFTTIANQPPVFGAPSPANGSINQPQNLTWNISINDTDGDLFNWTIECSNGQSNFSNEVTNGTKSLVLSGLSYNTIYTVWVNATDTNGSGLFNRTWYQFTTIVNQKPVFGTPSPANGSTNLSFSFTWSISINDSEGDSFNWSIECSNGQSANASDASNGTKSLSLSSLINLTTYTVWVNATDTNGSGLYTREWYQFTTIVSQKPVFGTPSPANGSTNQPLSLTWSISISDPEGEVFNWTIECSNGQNNSANNESNGTKNLSISGLYYYTNYYIWVNATDSHNVTSSEWFWFKTRQKSSGGGGSTPPNNAPVADANGPYNGIINTPILFDGLDSTDSDGTILSYDWNFGDGTTGEGESITHSYTVSGNYTVKLTVTDNGGQIDSDTTYAVISDKPNSPPDKPTINGNITGKKNTNYKYTVISIDEDDDSIKYVFDWDDETDIFTTDFMQDDTAYSVMHAWANPGIYTIKVKAVDEHNYSSETAELTVLIDVEYCGNIGYIIDSNSDGIYDLFHNYLTGNETALKAENGNYLIDSDEDGKWDFTFNLESGLSVYEEEKKDEEPGFEIILVLCAIALLLFLKRKNKLLG